MGAAMHPIAMPPLAGVDAVAIALDSLAAGHGMSGPVRASLLRAFGRHPLVRALFSIAEGRSTVRRIHARLYVCAPTANTLATASALFAEAQQRAAERFGEPAPLCLVQVPAVYGPRLAATPVMGLAYVQFPLYPAEGRAQALQSACHEMAHTYCWSGRRYLDEAVADWFAGNIPAEPFEPQGAGPSTRALIEAENGTDLHFEASAPQPADALRLRSRGVALAGTLATRLGAEALSGFMEELLAQQGPAICGSIERVLGQTLEQWDAARGCHAEAPFDVAMQLLDELEQGEPDELRLAELDAWIRDARRSGHQQERMMALLQRRMGLNAVRAGVGAAQREQIGSATKMAGVRIASAVLPPAPAGAGLALRIAGLEVGGDNGFMLRIAALDVAAGERIGLVGGNGAGKSTLLAQIAGAHHAAITIDDVALPAWMQLAANRRQVGAALTEYPYFPAMRVREVLALRQAMYGAADDEVAALFDLSAYLDVRMSDLSRGWKQVLALFLAFAHNPRLVLLDEPSLGLDEQHARALRMLLDPSRNRRPQTIIVASHVAADLQGMSRLVVLRHGVLASDGKVSAMLQAFGSTKVTVAAPEAEQFAHDLCSLPGYLGARRNAHGLAINGDDRFGNAFRAFAARCSLTAFSVQPSGIEDVLEYLEKSA